MYYKGKHNVFITICVSLLCLMLCVVCGIGVLKYVDNFKNEKSTSKSSLDSNYSSLSFNSSLDSTYSSFSSGSSLDSSIDYESKYLEVLEENSFLSDKISQLENTNLVLSEQVSALEKHQVEVEGGSIGYIRTSYTASVTTDSGDSYYFSTSDYNLDFIKFNELSSLLSSISNYYLYDLTMTDYYNVSTSTFSCEMPVATTLDSSNLTFSLELDSSFVFDSQEEIYSCSERVVFDSDNNLVKVILTNNGLVES